MAAQLPPAELVAVGDALRRAGHLDLERPLAPPARADRVRGVVRARACAPAAVAARPVAPGERDVDRYSLMAADGWLVLRFANRHLDGPWQVVDRTWRALVSRGWRPDPR
jgi:hypothetical protein